MSKNLLILSLVLIGLSQVHSAGNTWAVLVAGSNGFWNYRHQADVCHAYQTLLQKGIKKEFIITLAYDDIATAAQNPFKGKLFNKPTYAKPGVDVYAGCNIDYKTKDVTPQVFLAVLKGDKAAVAGKGNGRVVESTSQDNIFVFYSDHGSVGLIAFPSSYLYAKDMIPVLDQMAANKRFNKFVFYLEACESGSMFVNLKKDTKIYALSASSPSESSWGCYCNPDDVIENKHVGSCLGDLFSVNWMEHSDATDLTKCTLDEQFAVIKKLTTRSQVMQWGDVSYKTDYASEFIGPKKNSFLRKLVTDFSKNEEGMVDSRDIKLAYLVNQYKTSFSNDHFNELQQEVMERNLLDNNFGTLAKQYQLTGNYYQSNNQECYAEAIENYESVCGKMSDYGLKFFKYFAELCDTSNMTKEAIVQAAKQTCVVSA